MNGAAASTGSFSEASKGDVVGWSDVAIAVIAGWRQLVATEITSESTHAEILDFSQEQLDSPKRVAGDGWDVTNRSLDELIAFARYRRSSALMAGGMGGLVIQQLKPPSALGVHR